MFCKLNFSCNSHVVMRQYTVKTRDEEPEFSQVILNRFPHNLVISKFKPFMFLNKFIFFKGKSSL